MGKYPAQSIRDIWFGEKAETLRRAIIKDDLVLGCQSCEKYIARQNFEAPGSRQYDYLYQHVQTSAFPTMFDFELGSVCNFECIMCSGEYSSAIRVNREKQKAYLSPYDEQFVEQLKEFIPYLSETKFIGGEPFLIKIYYNIWDEIVRLNPATLINVLTNGSILSDRVKKLLDKGNFKIAVSIDSVVKETYEQIRVNANYDQVMENVYYFKKIMDERGHVMNFNVCAMQQNWKELPDYFRYCSNNNIKVVLHTVEFPNHCSLWNLPAACLADIFHYYTGQVFTTGSLIEKENAAVFHSLSQQVKSWLAEAEKREAAPGLPYDEMLNNVISNISVEVKADKNGLTADRYNHIIFDLLSAFNGEDRTTIVRFLQKLPVHLLVAELNISNKDRMTERFKIIARNKED